jgi:hypothetical protein
MSTDPEPGRARRERRRTPRRTGETPFDNIEAAHQYVGLLLDAVREARLEVKGDEEEAEQARVDRRLEALRLVAWKLERLESHLASSRRLLHDLGRLRRLLLGEEGEASPRPAGEDDPADEPFRKQ